MSIIPKSVYDKFCWSGTDIADVRLSAISKFIFIKQETYNEILDLLKLCSVFECVGYNNLLEIRDRIREGAKLILKKLEKE